MLATAYVWVSGVGDCYATTRSLSGCNAGSNGVPAALTSPIGGIASIAVANGAVTVTPVAQHGIVTPDTVVLTPSVGGSTGFGVDLVWASSGGAVTKGYVGAYVHPGILLVDQRTARFRAMAASLHPWVSGVEDCYVATGSLTGCNAGSNGVPAALTTPVGGIASITVANGVINLTPAAQNGIVVTDTYILTPTTSGGTGYAVDITWAASGGAVTAGYIGEYIHPGSSVIDLRATRFVAIAAAVLPWVSGVEDCYVATGSLTGCDAGSNGVPSALTTPVGGIASIAVANGVINLTPVAQHGIIAADTYNLTATVSAGTGYRIDITWAASGGAVTKGYIGPFIHPGIRITRLPVATYAGLVTATDTYETGVEDCYVATGSLSGCNAGSNGVPAAYIGGAGAPITSIAVANGVIHLTPAAQNGITVTDTYIRTPTIIPPASGPRLPQDIQWATSGGACAAGLVTC